MKGMNALFALLALMLALSVCGLVGCDRADKPLVEFRLAESEPTAGATEMKLPDSGEKFYIHEDVVLSDADIESAAATARDDGEPAVELIMTEAGRAKWAELTGQNVGKRVAMFVDGELRLAPVIRAPITQGRAILTGGFTADEAAAVAKQLNKRGATDDE